MCSGTERTDSQEILFESTLEPAESSFLARVTLLTVKAAHVPDKYLGKTADADPPEADLQFAACETPTGRTPQV